MVSRKVLTVAVPMMLLAGCIAQINKHGDQVDADRLEMIRPGVQNRDDVAKLLGSPSSTSAFGDEAWYYVSDVVETYSIFDSDVTERQVVTVRFDDRGVVKEVGEFGLDRGHEVELVTRETPSFGEELTIMDQLMGNLGRFNKDALQQPSRRQQPF